MTAPQEEEGTVIPLVVSKYEVISPVYSIGGYPWRLRTKKNCDGTIELFVRCDMSTVAELWVVQAEITLKGAEDSPPVDMGNIFVSWCEKSFEQRLDLDVDQTISERSLLEVKIRPFDFLKQVRRRSILDPLKPHDGILVVGNENKKIHVHKQCLASQSPFFDRLFYGEFREKDMNEIPIPDVEYEEFALVMRMIYGCDISLITHENVVSILQLADRFELKIVEDGVINYLLSTSSFTTHEKLLIADTHNNRFFKDEIIVNYRTSLRPDFIMLKELSESPQWVRLSKEIIATLFEEEFSRVHWYSEY